MAEAMFTAAGVTFTSDDLSDLDGIEARDFRMATGMSIAKAFQALAMQESDLEVVAGLAWLIKRRSLPGISYESVLKSVKFKDLEASVDEDDADPPTEPEDSSETGGQSSQKSSESDPGSATS